MEKRGAVNVYVFRSVLGGSQSLPEGARRYITCVNLAAGTTPFMHVVQHTIKHTDTIDVNLKLEYSSCMYKMPADIRLSMGLSQSKRPDLVLTHCHYRPGIEEFKNLPVETKKHVLLGGLLFGKFGECANLNDPISDDWQPLLALGWLATYYEVDPNWQKSQFYG